MKEKQIRYLNLLQIRFPISAIVSILHRVSGVILFIALPFALAALHYSVDSAKGYQAVIDVLSHPIVELLTILVVWALSHHLCAGIRFLLLDFHIGVSLSSSRFSAVITMIAGILLTLLFIIWLCQ